MKRKLCTAMAALTAALPAFVRTAFASAPAESMKTGGGVDPFSVAAAIIAVVGVMALCVLFSVRKR